MTWDTIAIIIPAYNEEDGVGDVVRAMAETFPGAEIVAVDDGSTDNTAEAARQAGARVISHDRNQGYGSALRTGVLAVDREFVLFCDADGQHRPEDAAAVAKACLDGGEGGPDMVVGARGKDSHTPAKRVPGKWLLKHFSNFLAGEAVPDINSGLRIMRREVILKYLHLMPEGFSFSTTSAFAFIKGGYRVRWVPITAAPRLGKSTLRQWVDGPQVLMLVLRLAVLFEPLKVFLTVSAGLLALTVFSLVNDLIASASRGGGVGETTVFLAVSTLMTFMFGLLCDQVSALRRNLKS